MYLGLLRRRGNTGCHITLLSGNSVKALTILVYSYQSVVRSSESEEKCRGNRSTVRNNYGKLSDTALSIEKMILRRNWALRLSIILNICVLLYICAHFGTGPWVEDGSSFPWENQSPAASHEDMLSEAQVNTSHRAEMKGDTLGTSRSQSDAASKVTNTNSPKEAGGSPIPANQTKTKESSPLVEPPAMIIPTLKEAIKCNDKTLEPRNALRGNFWVLYNYVPMNYSLHCYENVTYTTHADFTFLDNLVPLLNRWRAPISIALHAPGTDFQATVESIKYLRSCQSHLVTELVTFHVYFLAKYLPKQIPSSKDVMTAKPYNCSLGAPWANEKFTSKMFKTEKKLVYPVNVGRNVARESAVTHYVLASDIELYPSPGLPAKFLDMIRKNDQKELQSPNPKVFVLSIFEVVARSQPPENKTQLVTMLKNKTAMPFHQKLCSACHHVPKSKEWQEAAVSRDLHVFHVAKRKGQFFHWEPIYIGTNKDPLYDERLSWEGRSDKMTQGYILCVSDYDFLILDNAFLVHRPGIKLYKKDPYRQVLTDQTNKLLSNVIMPELKRVYGTRPGCTL